MSRRRHHHKRQGADDESYSSSDSDSSSSSDSGSSCSFDTDDDTRRAYVRPMTMAMAPSALDNNSTAAAVKFDILPYTPSRTASPADTVRTFIAPSSTANKASSTRRMTAQFDVIQSYANLRAQADGGKHMVLDTRSNTLRPSDISHSTPVAASEIGTSVDFPTRIEVTLDHNVDTSLMMETPVRALKSEVDHIFPGSQTAENPHGNIALRFPLGSRTAAFERTVDEGQINWMNTFGGQGAEDGKKWVSTINNNPDKKLLHVRPASGVAHFYNKLMQDPAQHVTEAMGDKILGTVVVNAADADKAVAAFETAMNDSINYSNLSDKNAIALKFGLAPRTFLDAKGVGKHTSVHLADAFKHTAAFSRTKTAAAAQSNPAQYLANAENSVLKNGNIELRGTMSVDYFHVDKNFRFAPRNA